MQDTIISTNATTRKQVLQWELMYCIVNILLIILLSQRYSFSIDLPDTGLSWFYYINLSFGHFSFLILLLFSLVFLPISLVVPKKSIIIPVNIIVMSFIISLIAVDTFVFDQYRFHISPFFIRMMLDAGDQIIGFSAAMWITLIFAIALILLIQSYLALVLWKYHQRAYNLFRPRLFFSITFGMYLISHILHIFADANYDRSITRLAHSYPLLNAATAKSFLIKQGWAQAANSDQFKTINKQSGINYPRTAINFNEEKMALNILIITLDSWRFDAMSEKITPNIFQFSQNTLNYTQHFSGANDTRTGIFSLFYGIPGNYWHSFESNQISPVLIDSMIDNGYETAVYASAPLINPEFDRTVFKNIPDLEVKTDGKTAYHRDENVISKWINWTQEYSSTETKKPFFGFLFLDAIHAYQYPDEYPRHFQPTADNINYFTLHNNADTRPISNLYNNVTHYMDSLVGKIISDLKRKELLENTVVVITGDHGQEINDNNLNFWGHNSNFTKYQTQVPLIIHWPGKPATNIDTLTSHYDLVPTLMKNALHASTDVAEYSIGRDLFSDEIEPLESMIMTNFSMTGVIDFKNNTMLVRKKNGSVDYLNSNYQPVNRKPAGHHLTKAMEQMSRFFK